MREHKKRTIFISTSLSITILLCCSCCCLNLENGMFWVHFGRMRILLLFLDLVFVDSKLIFFYFKNLIWWSLCFKILNTEIEDFNMLQILCLNHIKMRLRHLPKSAILSPTCQLLLLYTKNKIRTTKTLQVQF